LVVRRLLPPLTGSDAVDVIAAATSLSGAFWQMATPGPEIAALYRSDPRLSHAVVDVEARVQRLLTAVLQGFLAGGCTGFRTWPGCQPRAGWSGRRPALLLGVSAIAWSESGEVRLVALRRWTWR